MYSIGEFSKIVSLSIKSLRIYHDKGLLIPAFVDEFTGYRYYDDNNIETATVITLLKRFGFSLIKIKQILKGYDRDSDILEFLNQQHREIEFKLKEYQEILNSIEHIIFMEKTMTSDHATAFEIELKTMETILIAGFRMTGQYQDAGIAFSKLGKTLGRQIVGKPMTLYYDDGYKEKNAQFEPCYPVWKAKNIDGIRVRQLPEIRCATLIHKGPYQSIGQAYGKLFTYISREDLTPVLPYCEKYIKGPGMVFKGNPKNYLTEVIIPIKAKVQQHED